MGQSFEELVKQYKPMIYSIIKKLHISKEYEEYYQLGLIALWEAVETFEENKSSFSSFAYKKIYWKIVSHLRKQLHTKNFECPIAVETLNLITVSLDEQHEFHHILEYISTDLTPFQKAWLVGCIYEGKSLKEIAEERGVSVGAVKQWRIKALQKLRNKWPAYKDLFTTN